MPEKPLSYWIAVLGVSLWLMGRDAETEGVSRRIVKTLSSALLAVGLSEDMSQWTGLSETLCAVSIMAFGLIFLDLVTAIFQDRAFIKRIIQARFGKGGQ